MCLWTPAQQRRSVRNWCTVCISEIRVAPASSPAFRNALRHPSANCLFGKGLNLRRRGSDAVRREKPEWVAGGYLLVSFAFPADASVLTIFKNYTTFRQFFADFVALGKIAPLPRSLPFRDFRFDPGVRHSFFRINKSELF
jgi:hypothetical protein